MPRGRSYRDEYDQDAASQHSCSRLPPELCDGARLVDQGDGTTRREPGLTPRAFCDPCEQKIIACLDELPDAYERLAEAIGDPVRGGGTPVRRPPGSRVLVSPEIDALMRLTATILSGWAARVRAVPGLQLADPEHPFGTAAGVREACGTLAAHPTPLLSLPARWMTRTFTYPPASDNPPESTCLHCGHRITPGRGEERRVVRGRTRWWLAGKAAAPVAACAHEPDPARTTGGSDVIPAELAAILGDREIIRQGDGWLDVQDELSGADAGNEIIDLHWRARRILGETRAQPESFDGIPCQECDGLTLERAEPPSDPSLPAMHSRCAECRDEMSREEFDQWAERYASWARGAGVQVCRRCGLGQHGECCWAPCSCTEGQHPRRRAVA